MNWSDLLSAFALYLVIEGLFPFISPAKWRQSLAVIARLKEGQLRFFGLLSILSGLLLLLWVR